MIGSPLISIAVCTYNGAKYLKEQLDSLVNQTYINLEIIICDDCSSDDTVQIIRQFAIQYSNVKYEVNATNLGYIKNFENVLRLCKGDFVTLCDQDDIWIEDKIKLMLGAFDEETVLLYHNSNYMNENGDKIGLTLAQTSGYISGSNPYQLAFHNCVAGHAMMFKKELIEEILPFPQLMPHDHWIAFVALNLGNVQYLSKALVNYRQHTHSITDILNQRKESDKKLEVLRKLRTRSKINKDRIQNLKAMQAYPKNMTSNIVFYGKIIKHLEERDQKYFSYALFKFLLLNRNTLFSFYRKNIFSVINKIFKESIGNKGKLQWFKLMH